jgi:hypothetical protein
MCLFSGSELGSWTSGSVHGAQGRDGRKSAEGAVNVFGSVFFIRRLWSLHWKLQPVLSRGMQMLRSVSTSRL